MTDIEIKKGLAGVTVDYTAVSKVNPETNSLLYRGYPVQELAATQPFEAVAYLLWHGELPTEDELAALVAEERAQRTLDDNVRQAIDLVPLDAHPMDVRAHGGVADRRVGSGGVRQLPRVGPREVAAPVREASRDRRLRPAPPPRPRHRRPARRPRLLAELPLDDLRRGARPGRRARLQRLDDPVRRALVQRVDLHRARHHVHAGRPLLRRRRRDRRAQGAAARRRQRGGHAHLRRDRLGRERRTLARHRARREAQDHGLRSPRLQARRLARADHEGRPRHPRRALFGRGRQRPRPRGAVRHPRVGVRLRARASTRTSTTRRGPPTT